MKDLAEKMRMIGVGWGKAANSQVSWELRQKLLYLDGVLVVLLEEKLFSELEVKLEES